MMTSPEKMGHRRKKTEDAAIHEVRQRGRLPKRGTVSESQKMDILHEWAKADDRNLEARQENDQKAAATAEERNSGISGFLNRLMGRETESAMGLLHEEAQKENLERSAAGLKFELINDALEIYGINGTYDGHEISLSENRGSLVNEYQGKIDGIEMTPEQAKELYKHLSPTVLEQQRQKAEIAREQRRVAREAEQEKARIRRETEDRKREEDARKAQSIIDEIKGR